MKFVTVILCLSAVCVNGYLELPLRNPALDQTLYEDALDPELCVEQLNYIVADPTLRLRFLDAGIRTPRGILEGNFVDMGNYPQCLGITEDLTTSIIQGKYCSISVPFNQEDLQLPSLPDWEDLPDFPWPELLPNSSTISEEIWRKISDYESKRIAAEILSGSYDNAFIRTSEDGLELSGALSLAVCVPKTCTTKQATEFLLFNVTSIGLNFVDSFCRLPNDKPWVPADYIALVVLTIIGLLTLCSTVYDVRHTVVLKKDPKSASAFYQSFSVYTNCRRLTTFTSTASTLECLDGLRVLAMMWVIVGHTFSTQVQTHIANYVDVLSWLQSFHSIWVMAAPITVDTFFMLSGLLLVYTTVGKFGKMKFISNVHLFYLNRLLRMFPVLALGVLLQASVFNRLVDGPNWSAVALKTEKCRTYWWSTLLHVQNYAGDAVCLGHTWYLAIDIQMYILSPIIIFWVLGGRKSAWIALTVGLLASLTAATTYSFLNNFQSAVLSLSSRGDGVNYMRYYYMNTITRSTPFFVGMIFGYLLVIWKGKQIYLKPFHVAGLWILAAGTSLAVILVTYPIAQPDWDNQLIDNLINSFMRPVWAGAVGWMIFACAKGYGGAINWFLSLRMWKLPSRLSYAMYILHYPLIFMVNSTAISPGYFSEGALVFRFFSDLVLTVIAAFLATLLVDSPCSTLIKLALTGGQKRPRQVKIEKDHPNNGTLNPTFVPNNGIEYPPFEHYGKTKL